MVDLMGALWQPARYSYTSMVIYRVSFSQLNGLHFFAGVCSQ